MNQGMKQLVDVAFRALAWQRAESAAREAGRESPPMPPDAFDLLRRMIGRTERPADGFLFSDVNEQERHKLMRLWWTLLGFAASGCTIISLDHETAIGFAVSSPPSGAVPTEWPIAGFYGICVGEGVVLVQQALLHRLLPKNMREHFRVVVDGVVPIEASCAGMDGMTGENALLNLANNIGAALVRRPDGLSITERRPSRQAARKQGKNPDRLASVEFVIGAVSALGSSRSPGEEGDGGAPPGHAMKVRTLVSPHWTHQVCGPRGSERRLQWLASHWRGPEDAPVSVHAMRVVGKPSPKK